jgi:hypothetical protein
MTRTLTAAALTAAAAATMAIAACAPVVNSYAIRGLDMAAYRTYDWVPGDQRPTGDPRLDNSPFFHEYLRASVEKRLAARGLERRTTSKPDLLLHYHASVSQEIVLSGVNEPSGSCRDCTMDVFDAGSLVIDFVDPRTNTLVWRGWAEGTIEGVIDNQDWLEERIDDAVSRIVGRLPARVRGPSTAL